MPATAGRKRKIREKTTDVAIFILKNLQKNSKRCIIEPSKISKRCKYGKRKISKRCKRHRSEKENISTTPWLEGEKTRWGSTLMTTPTVLHAADYKMEAGITYHSIWYIFWGVRAVLLHDLIRLLQLWKAVAKEKRTFAAVFSQLLQQHNCNNHTLQWNETYY